MASSPAAWCFCLTRRREEGKRTVTAGLKKTHGFEGHLFCPQGAITLRFFAIFVSSVVNSIYIGSLAFFICFRIVLDIMTTTRSPHIKQRVVLLHGLARSRRSMARLERKIAAAGFDVRNIGYPSTRYPIQELAARFVLPAIRSGFQDSDAPIHFVTHSMGGIIVRVLAEINPELAIGRVVMLSPPNQGSEVVDCIGRRWLFTALHGPAGSELGTGPDSIPNRLGPPDFELGVLTGDRSINLLLSLLITGPNDGKVSVKSAQLASMRDFRVLHTTHPFILRNPIAIRETICFLRYGAFSAEETRQSTHDNQNRELPVEQSGGFQ